MPTDAPAVEARGLSKTYPARARSQAKPRAKRADDPSSGTRALDHLDLVVPAGTVFGFLGRNGAGKTTAVRIFTTLLRPSAGVARVLGWDVVEHPDAVRRRIGVALQETSLDPRQTAQEILTLHGELYGLQGRDLVTAVEAGLEQADLGEAAARPIETYSGGMRRRLDLATALIHQPALVFLDEPTTGLDPQSRADIWATVRRLRATGTGVFMTTQYLEEADALADEVAVIHSGAMVAQGSPTDLKATWGTETLEITVGPEAIGSVAARVASFDGVRQVDVIDGRLVVDAGSGTGRALGVATQLAADGVPLASVVVRPATLEDVYLRLTGKVAS